MSWILTDFGVVRVDDQDDDLLHAHHWGCSTNGYAKHQEGGRRRARKSTYLHKLIGERMGHAYDQLMDHINGDRLDCRRANLRPATKVTNGYNAKLSDRNKSGVKGVCWAPRERMWRVYIVVEKRQISGGYFRSLEDAKAKAEQMRRELHGEFARFV